jgi:hypothetical protein
MGSVDRLGEPDAGEDYDEAAAAALGTGENQGTGKGEGRDLKVVLNSNGTWWCELSLERRERRMWRLVFSLGSCVFQTQALGIHLGLVGKFWGRLGVLAFLLHEGGTCLVEDRMEGPFGSLIRGGFACTHH